MDAGVIILRQLRVAMCLWLVSVNGVKECMHACLSSCPQDVVMESNKELSRCGVYAAHSLC